MSSAGVYKKSVQMPHQEGDMEDVKSRHKGMPGRPPSELQPPPDPATSLIFTGKLETEAYLKSIDIPFTSIRPTYIYGPMNYNPLEE